MSVCLVLTAAASRQAALKLAKALVSSKLAACVTAVPGAVSVYKWKGKLEVLGEVLLLVKTERRFWPKVRRFLKKNHPYELPEIVLLPANASKEYSSWIASSLK
jgi:periplasmic divalent cation tolerance protein